jgi:4-hydroxybenzoate polyprenyltransferase
LLLGYLAVAVSYTLWLKNVPIVDLFCISAGFLLRLMAGGEVFGIAVSEWLFLSVFLLSLFLSTGKRLSEKYTLGEQAASHRKTLGEFPEGFLEGTMYMTGAAVLVTYTMYVISRHMQMATVILCTFGLLRYIFRIRAGQGGDPTESLLKDPILFGVGLLWALMVSWGIYGG